VRAGKARFRVTIKSPTASVDDTGQASYTFQEFKHWAAVKSIRGNLDARGIQQTEGRRWFMLRMRYDSHVDYGCEIIFKGRTLRPERIDNVGEVNHELVVYAYEVDL